MSPLEKEAPTAYNNPSFESDVKTDKPSEHQTPKLPDLGVNDDPKSPRSFWFFIKTEKWRVLINLGVIALAFFFLFTSFNGITTLQSSINPDIGTDGLTAIYIAMIISCIFLPSLVISKLTVKWTMVASTSGYILYMFAQFYPTKMTLVTAGTILGLGAASLWSAQCTYFNEVAQYFAKVTGKNSSVVISRFFSIFFLIFQLSFATGNLISALVLTKQGRDKTPEEISQYCGINFCPGVVADNVTLLHPPAANDVLTMNCVYIALAIGATLVMAICVDPLTTFIKKQKEEQSIVTLISATALQLMEPIQLVLIPLTLYSGLEQSFLQTDFSASWVTCGIGVHMVGYAFIAYALVDASVSGSLVFLTELIDRRIIFVVAAGTNVLCIILLNTMTITSFGPILIIAGLWGVSDAVWQTQINALYGIYFPGKSEAAYSNYRLWESIGFAVGYISDGKLCVLTKLIVVCSFLVIGICGYFFAERLHNKKQPQGES